MTEPLDGIVVVTGAAGGLGRALALELVARSVTVAGIDGTATALAETGTQAKAPQRFHAIPCDVAEPEAVRAAFARIRRIGPVSVLINNAAVYPRRDFLDETPESFMATIATNLGGYVACCHCALEDMVQAGRGRILNVSTVADSAPIPASSAYAVSNGAASMLTLALIADICDRFPGIVINDWRPGLLAPPMGVPDGLDPATAAKWGADLALWRERGLSGTVWERDIEILPRRSLKRRVFDRLTMRTPPLPRRLRG